MNSLNEEFVKEIRNKRDFRMRENYLARAKLESAREGYEEAIDDVISLIRKEEIYTTSGKFVDIKVVEKNYIAKEQLDNYITKELETIEKNNNIELKGIYDGMKSAYLAIKNLFLEEN